MANMNYLELILWTILTLWVFCLGISLMFGAAGRFWNFTTNAIRGIFQHAWQLILGILIGYLLSLPSASVHF